MGTMRAGTGKVLPGALAGVEGGGGALRSQLHLDFKLLTLKAVKEVSIGLSHQIPNTLSLEQTNRPLDTIETHVPKHLATPFRTLLLWRKRRAPRPRLYCTGQV